MIGRISSFTPLPSPPSYACVRVAVLHPLQSVPVLAQIVVATPCITKFVFFVNSYSLLAIAIHIPFLSIHTAGSFHCGPLARDELTVSPHVSQ